MTDTQKEELLRSLGNAEVAQIVAVSWADGIKYYATTAVDDIPPFRSVPLRPVEPRLLGKDFLQFELSPDLQDEEITLNFSDLDQEIQSKFFDSGEGVRVELFYYYPQADYLVSKWFGQLSPPDSNSYETFSAKAASGFASRLMLLPRRPLADNCSAMFGFHLKTQAEINESDCPYNRHIAGGSIGNLNGGVPFEGCEKTSAACTARLGDAFSYMGFNVSASPIVSDKFGNLAGSRGNSNNLKRPLRVILGYKHIRDLDLLAWRREPTVKDPDKGFIAAIWAISEGTNAAVFGFRVNDGAININAINYRTGELRQPETSYGGGISNFSGTSLLFARLGHVNAAEIDATNLKTFLAVHGKNDIRVYSNPTTYAKQLSNTRAWGLLECYANRRWGRGLSYDRFHLNDWKAAAEWGDESINYVDPNGVVRPHRRTQLDVDLQGRVTHEQIIDICRAGRMSVPFQYNGKYSIRPLKIETNLNACRVFTDVGDDKNIVKDGNKPAISYSIQSDRVIPNEVKLVFEDMNNLDIERPLTFIDEEQQLKAGRAFGDTSVRAIQKQYSGFGIRTEAEAIKLGYTLLHLGEFDSGGLKNNLRVQFTTWHTQVLGLKRFDVIKIISPLISRFGFSYFRVLRTIQQSNLFVNVTAQAYPETYYNSMEALIPPTPILPSGFVPIYEPKKPVITSNYANGLLNISVTNP